MLKINYEVTHVHTFMNHCNFKFKFHKRRMSLTIDDFQLERFDNATCMGSFVNSENELWADIHSKIKKAKEAYLAYIKPFSSEFLSRNI